MENGLGLFAIINHCILDSRIEKLEESPMDDNQNKQSNTKLLTEEDENQCFLCNRTFTKKSSLKQHFHQVHERPNQIKLEEDQTKSSNTMFDNELLCPLCSKSFTKKANLQRHIEQVHEKNKAINCNLCESTFHSLRGLKRHISSVHEKLRPHQCSQCDKSFSEAGKLRTHISTVHEGKKLFERRVC